MNQILADSDVNRKRAKRPAVAPEISSAFWSRVKVSAANDCWPWAGAKRAAGYGDFKTRAGRWRAHRLALILHDGRDAKKVVRHLCDNPACCNPNHLAWGTDQENAYDRMSLRDGRKTGPLHPRNRQADRRRPSRPSPDHSVKGGGYG